MLIALFLVFTIVAIYHAVQFYFYLGQIAVTWELNSQIKIFGVSFRRHSQMYGDMSFLNNLWIGNNLSDVPEDNLKSLLVSARKHLRFQFSFGFLAFVSVILNGLVGV